MKKEARARANSTVGQDFNKEPIFCAFPTKEQLLYSQNIYYPNRKHPNGSVFEITLIGSEIGKVLYYVKGREKPFVRKSYAWAYCIKNQVSSIVVVPKSCVSG